MNLNESGVFIEKENWDGIVLKDLTSRSIAVKSNLSSKSSPFSIFFDLPTSSLNVVASIDYNKETRILSFYTLDVKRYPFSDNTEELFSGKLTILSGEEDINCYRQALIKQHKLEKDLYRRSLQISSLKYKIFFDKGCGRIYWRKIELTKEFGLYTSILSSKCWHDSTRAVWSIEKATQKEIFTRGKWLYLPIEQIWQISVEENYILWKIHMVVNEEVIVEEEQTNVMFSKRYGLWSAPGNKGCFPKEFNGYWKVLYQSSAEGGDLAVEETTEDSIGLPSVIFRCSSMRGYLINVLDSDKKFEGRVLQCQRKNIAGRAKIFPGRYEYFKGRIIIKNETR